MNQENLSKFQIILPSHINERLNELGFYDIISDISPNLALVDELINLYTSISRDSNISQVIWDCLVDGYIYLQRLNYNFYVRVKDEINHKISQIDSNFVNNDFSTINDIIHWLESYIILLENYPQYKKSLVYCGACSLYFKF